MLHQIGTNIKDQIIVQLRIQADKGKNNNICFMSSGSGAEVKLSTQEVLVYGRLSDNSVQVEQPLISDNVTVV